MKSFHTQWVDLIERVWLKGEEVEVGQWQSQDVTDRPEMVSREVRHETFRWPIQHTMESLQAVMGPTLSLPWAEDHFQERVSGIPWNPPPSEEWWPYRVRGNEDHKSNGMFSHTYPERMWPKGAGHPEYWDGGWFKDYGHRGIHYMYGDLNDVLDMLQKNPLTRQAFLPIWFPEDTGAVEGQRVPCTLGYHFLIRRDRLDVVYYIRSCDLLRHFTDDVYMAARLAQWVVGMLQGRGMTSIAVNELIMHISSLHYFRGDYPRVQMILTDREDEEPYGAAV